LVVEGVRSERSGRLLFFERFKNAGLG
jgi:hypothetical protein